MKDNNKSSTPTNSNGPQYLPNREQLIAETRKVYPTLTREEAEEMLRAYGAL